MSTFPQELIRQSDVYRQLGTVKRARQLSMEVSTMAQDLEMEVKAVLVEVFRCTDEQVLPKSRLRQDLGLDEFEIMDFAEELEARLDIPVPVQEVTSLQTVQDVIDHLSGVRR